jgi:DNA invertase Pin-like site-specific DNA recombinase
MARQAVVARDTKRVVGYLRVSTDEQSTSGYGIDAQRAAIEAHCQRGNLELVAVYTDEGISGTKDASQRPALAAVLALVASGEVDGVIVKSLDRVGRSLAVIANTLQSFQQAGVSFTSTQEPHLNSPLVLSVYMGLAAEDRQRIVTRTVSGRVAKASAGGVVGRPAYGYRVVGSKRNAQLEIVLEQAEVIRGIFTAKASGASYSAIVADLNQRHVPSFSGKPWTTATVHHIVHNTTYTGTRQWTGSGQTYDLDNPAIVDEATWQAAQ